MLNIFGLAISLCVAILLVTYGRQELSFNKQFDKQENLYRVIMQANSEYNFEKWTELPNAVGPALLADIPEITSMARIVKLDFTGFGSIRANEHNYIEQNIHLVDSSLFDLFNLKFSEGNSRTAFLNPKSIVISEQKKQKIFGDQPALNQKLIINQRDTVTVSAVVQDFPKNSTFEADLFLNIMDSWMGKNVYWSNASYQTFCLLRPDADVANVGKKATALIDKYVPKDHQYYIRFFLQPLSKIHLYSADFRDSITKQKGSITTVRTVFLLSILIVIIACINYMNLATARSQKNAKEVGINKVLGAQRSQIKVRFYIETAIITFFAIVVGLGIALVALPAFNQLISDQLNISQLLSLENSLLCFGIWLLVTLVGGSYPAVMMSKIPSLTLMKKLIINSNQANYLRKGLVVFQFTCSSILIIGVIVVSLQMQHVAQKDLGYEPNGIVIVPIRSINSPEKFNNIKASISNLANTDALATVQSYPGFGESGKTIYRPGGAKEGLPIRSSSSYGPVVPTLGLHLLAGSDIPELIAKNDTSCYMLINEVIAGYLGYKNPEEAVGQHVQTEMSTNTIITGVVRNFNFESLKDAVGGYTYYRMNNPNEGYRYFLIRHHAENITTYVTQLRSIFEQQLPDAAFDYQFLDDYITGFYTTEYKTNKIITTFSFLTIGIACLGLFGLMAFTAEQRRKEIGVRKVLGASIYKIIHMLSVDFLSLILIALLIATPIAWWLLSTWLDDFNYKIEIPWWSFLMSGLFSLAIALLTVGYQALRAAKTNPVDSLRNE